MAGQSETFESWPSEKVVKGQLEVKDEKENMALVDRVAIVEEVYSAVCQLHKRL